MQNEVDQSLYSEEYFTKINDGWKEFGTGTLTPRLARAVELAAMDWKGKKVLDIGFGRGELLVHLAKLGAECYGIDYSDASVKIAREYAAKNNAAVRLSKKEVTAIDYPADFFDAVFMLDVVEHLTDTQLAKCYASVAKSLAPEGRFIVHTMPNKIVALPFYALSKLVGSKRGVNEHVHINEQSPFSLKKGLSVHFAVRIKMAHQKNYFKNTTFYAKFKPVIKPVVDLCLTHDFSKAPLLNNFIASEIWAVCTKKKD